MNSKQITSFVAWLLNALSGGVIAYTAAKSPAAQSVGQFMAALITGPDVAAGLVLIISQLVQHFMHEDLSGPSNPPAKTTGGNSLLLLALACGLSAMIFTGCASAPAASYKAVSSVDLGVTSALTAWNDYLAANPATPQSQRDAVRAAFSKVQASELLALDAAEAIALYTGTNAAPAGAVTNSQAAAANAAAALADLVSLLGSFGVKL